MSRLTKPEMSRLYAKYSPSILLRCRALCGNHTDADEVLQETFLRAWKSRRSFRSDNPLGWLHTIARNACIDRIRRRKHSEVSWAFIGELSATLVPTDANLDAKKILAQFSAEDAVILRLRHIEGWDLNDIAEQFDTSRRTLARRIESLEKRARARARQPELT